MRRASLAARGDATRVDDPGRQRRAVHCPTCGVSTPWDDNPLRPFCSPTCRLIDLGRWLDERYRVEADDGDVDESLEEPPPPDLSPPPAAPPRVP